MKKGDRVSFRNTAATGTIVRVFHKNGALFPIKSESYKVKWDDGVFSYPLYNSDLSLI